MPRGYRSIGFAALIAAILLSFGLGAYWVSLGQPEQPDRYPSYKSGNSIEQGASASVADVSASIVERTPCHKPESETESDLCAQWSAAKAAEKSANWTLYGVIASAIGISLLLWQITLTREAVEDTGKATAAMERQNVLTERQQRPWVTIGISEPFVSKRSDGMMLVCTVDLGNIGATPAFNASVDFALGPGVRNPIYDFQITADNVIADKTEGSDSLIILPNGTAQSQIFIDLKRGDPRHPFDHGVVPTFMVWANYTLPDGTHAHSSAWFTVCPEVTCDAHPPMFYWNHTHIRDDEDVIEIDSHGYIRVT
jgi:hypothetical protein